MNNKILKELFIILLLVIVIMFAFAILFYDCISADNLKISSIEYIIDSETNKVLKDIQLNSGVDIEKESSNYLLKSYSIDKDDLSLFASENSYESGKSDPFAESAEPVEERTTTITTVPEKTNSEVNDTVILNDKDKVTNEVISNTIIEPQNEVKANTVKVEEKKNTNEVKNQTKNNKKSEKQTNTVKEESTVGTFFENKSSK